MGTPAKVLPLFSPLGRFERLKTVLMGTFVQRVVQECGVLFEPVEEIICDKFLPQLLGSEFTPGDRAVFALPVKVAGLGIPNPTTTAKNAFRTSKRAASHLTDAISGQGEMDHINHGQVVMEARTEHRGSRRQEHVANLNSTLAKFADDKQRIVRRAADHPIGAWLSVLPCAKQNAVLSPREFRDGLCMRYQLPLQHLHDRCDGCQRRECPAITYMAMGFRPRSFPVGGMYVKGVGRLTKVKKNHSLLFSIAS